MAALLEHRNLAITMPCNRLVSIAAISGALLLFAGTYLHPMSADPNVPLAAFMEYAADQHWVSSHLMQFSGIALMAAALVLISRALVSPRIAASSGSPGNPESPGSKNDVANAAATLAAAGAIASLAATAALQAIDGVALKAMVNAWAAAAQPDKESLFQAAFAVRQIETGLASISALLFGLTVSLFGIALLLDPRFPKWLGTIAIVGGAPTAVAGVVIAYTGFSGLAMAIDMPAGFLLLCWMIALGVYFWQRPAL
jgi:hypothetical protein